MTSIQSICDGVFLGQLIGSNYDSSSLLAVQLSESLIELKRFDGPVVLSKYLFIYHQKRCAVGNILRCLYDELYAKTGQTNDSSPMSVEDFRFDSSIIEQTVKFVDEKYQNATAACGPAHRSFPLALCPSISDDDLFEISIKEAALTHFNPIAGQVSGIINLILRSLLRTNDWTLSIENAFATARLHEDVVDILYRFTRWPTLSRSTHPAYAPAVLNAALFYVQRSENFQNAIELAKQSEKLNVLTLVGLLGGARWGVPTAMFTVQNDQNNVKTMRNAANRLTNLWNSKISTAKA